MKRSRLAVIVFLLMSINLLYRTLVAEVSADDRICLENLAVTYEM